MPLIQDQSKLINKNLLILCLPPDFLSDTPTHTHCTPVTCCVGVSLLLPHTVELLPVIPEYCLGTVDFLHYSTCIILLY